MKKEDFFWLLWGIGLAFGIQVFYDGAGEYPNLGQKFWYGLVIEAVLLIGLFLYGLTIKRGNQK